MRNSFAFVFFIAVSGAMACGKGADPGGVGGADAPGSGSGSANLAFQVSSDPISLAPGEEETYCWWFHTSNTTTALINKWESTMVTGSHHLILFTGGAEHADGLDTTNSCGLGTSSSATNPPVWVYASQQLLQTVDLPTDDGTGKPLAQPIAPNTEAAIQMHYINETDNTLMAHDEIQAYELPANTPYTRTDAYITYNNDLAIPAGAVPPQTGTSWTATCPVPAGVQFWSLSTHSHKQDLTVAINDGSNQVFESTNWSDPGVQLWNSTPFYTFSNELTWTCTYANDAPGPYEPTGQSNANVTVVAGPSAATNEMCMAVGYYFPSTGPTFGLETNGNCYSESIAGDN